MTQRGIRFSGMTRGVRATLIGGGAVFVTVVAHSAAGGWDAPTAPLLLSLLVCVALSSTVADRRLRISRLLMFVAALQVLIHVSLVVGSVHAGSEHGHGNVLPDGRMLTAHIVASLVVVAALAYGDEIAHRWIRFLRQLTRVFACAVQPPPCNGCPAGTRKSAMAHTLRLEHVVARRGPPVVAVHH